MDFDRINFIIQNFFFKSKVLKIVRVDSGLINETYIIDHMINGKKSKFILQRLSNLFDSNEIVNMNHKLITDHIQRKIKRNYVNLNNQRWEVPDLIKCHSNNLFLFPFDSGFWRAMVYIDKTFNFDTLEDEIIAYQVGIGLAKFHSLCSDFEFIKLKKSIKYFHDTNYFINKFYKIIKDFNFDKIEDKVNKRVHNLIYNLSSQIEYVKYLLSLIEKKSIDNTVIHGDPKLSNFLFDNQYKYVVSLIDLDTVSSGYLLTDLADCIRSICNAVGEDPECIENVRFDINTCMYFLKGYFSIPSNKGNYYFCLIPEFIYIIILELTIRFLSDFLLSNNYFKIKYQTHNLYRAEVQYRLLSSFVAQLPTLTNSLGEVGIFSNTTFVSDVQKIV